MVLSDSLEMVGVELKATWAQTRRANGEIVQHSKCMEIWKVHGPYL
jgi:hypothetical protein